LKLLEAMDIPYDIIPENFNDAKLVVERSIKYINENNSPLALIIKKNLFELYKLQNKTNTNFEMKREAAIKLIVDSIEDDDIVVSTTGKTSRELYEYRRDLNQGHKSDFLTVGSMGHANQIALGIALQKPKRNVYCFDGAGAVIMHMGSMGIIGDLAPKIFRHIIFNNGSHDSVGGQPTIGFNTDFCKIAEGFKYVKTFRVNSIRDLKKFFKLFSESGGPVLMEILINRGARENLGRPTNTPIENKETFITYVRK